MKNRKNSPVPFGITPASANRTEDGNSDLGKWGSAVHRENAMQGKTPQVSTHGIDFPRMKLPPPGKRPFTPDMFTCSSMPKRTFPPPRKMSKEEERIHKELKRLRSLTASHPASEKSSSMAASAAWEFFKLLCAGVFVVLKYTFIAICLIITIGCFMCAGRQTREVKYRW